MRNTLHHDNCLDVMRGFPDVGIPVDDGRRAIEDDGFPFEKISEIAEAESWRKEINRPIYHIHKWWARRLGSVFRAIAIAVFSPSKSNVVDLFYRPMMLSGKVVFDPFMGSGTTIGEVAKLGGRAIGWDINPVAHFLVKNALSVHDRSAIQNTFQDIKKDVGDSIRRHYQCELPDGTIADVLYFFWVKILDCPVCDAPVDLFSNYIFAKHAYPRKHPTARAICPNCGDINDLRYDSAHIACATCGARFNPQDGPARGQISTCPSCHHQFHIAEQVRNREGPPRHRLYAKLLLMPDGSKCYLRATEDDIARYNAATNKLAHYSKAFPIVQIQPGYNTNQVLRYNYRYWYEMFNARQLLCLSILADRIRKIEDVDLRNLFTCLFSGTLEFNNQFASYKGEGTGAVRPMFAHHILKPERTPIEANLWGTPKSSGSFLNMFEGRIRRALDYADAPFEIKLSNKNGRKRLKVFGISQKLGFPIAKNYRDFDDGSSIYLSCGDSSNTDIPDRTVDAIITDPPFFDNVHYSQLADFFYVWQRHILGEIHIGNGQKTTRSSHEVQNDDVETFTNRLRDVWKEAHRVLKDKGLLVFTYHHSRSDGWRAVLQALMEAGFVITATHPIKAEMSVAMPKHQAKEPIDLDIIMACRKRSQATLQKQPGSFWVDMAARQVERLQAAGRKLSRNDVRVILMAQLLRGLSIASSTTEALQGLDESERAIAREIENLHLTKSTEGNTGSA